MRNFLKLLFLAPIAVIFLSFDMANRQNVVISFDPFNSADALLPQITVPLFAVLIASTMLGVLLGGAATWIEQGRHRKATREAKAAAEKLRRENEALRAQILSLKTPGSGGVPALAPARSAA